MSRIAVIRMKGKFSLSPTVKSTLETINLPRLYSCTLLAENDTTIGMLQACKDVVSFGAVDEQIVELLLTKRGLTRDGKKLSASKKPDEISKLAKEISTSEKSLSTHGILPIFFLAPPKGGMGSKKFNVASGGVLGKNAAIGELISRMA
jgi:ribosomal protein L30/L7E